MSTKIAVISGTSSGIGLLTAVELALEAGAPTKTHLLNLLHRLVDGKPVDAPPVKPLAP